MATWSWSAEKRSMERSFTLIAGGQTRIIDINPPEDDLGYTSKDKTIHLAYDHPTMNGLDDKQKAVFRKGVFCHEMLHQILTNFDVLEKALKEVSGSERKILAMISNILEDPAIEFWAPTVVSGALLKSLRFSIAHIYNGSPKIEESQTAFGQYISALIQFGDMGLIKGRFTFPESQKTFADTAEVFEKGVTEPVAAKRMDYAKQIFEISRPLWQAEVDKAKALQELADMLSELGKSPATGSGQGMDCDSSSAPESKKNKRRKVTIKKVSKEEMEKLKKENNSSCGPIPEDADVTIYTCDEEEREENNKNSNVPEAPGENDEKSEDKSTDTSEDDVTGDLNNKSEDEQKPEVSKNATENDASYGSGNEEDGEGSSDSAKQDGANNEEDKSSKESKKDDSSSVEDSNAIKTQNKSSSCVVRKNFSFYRSLFPVPTKSSKYLSCSE